MSNDITLNHRSSFFLINLLIVFGWPFGDNICSTGNFSEHPLYSSHCSKCHGHRKEEEFSGSLPFKKFSVGLGEGRIWKVKKQNMRGM